MADRAKPIRLSGHASAQILFRGATEDEVPDAIRDEPWGPAEFGCLQSHKDYAFNREWNGRMYSTKQVRPIFAEESEEIVVVTFYVYYF